MLLASFAFWDTPLYSLEEMQNNTDYCNLCSISLYKHLFHISLSVHCRLIWPLRLHSALIILHSYFLRIKDLRIEESSSALWLLFIDGVVLSSAVQLSSVILRPSSQALFIHLKFGWTIGIYSSRREPRLFPKKRRHFAPALAQIKRVLPKESHILRNASFP